MPENIVRTLRNIFFIDLSKTRFDKCVLVVAETLQVVIERAPFIRSVSEAPASECFLREPSGGKIVQSGLCVGKIFFKELGCFFKSIEDFILLGL